VPPNEQAQRGLTLIAKVLQNIANGVTFGKKEHFLEWLNPFIAESISACQDYFDEVAVRSSITIYIYNHVRLCQMMPNLLLLAT
jgi:hypothetical protein